MLSKRLSPAKGDYPDYMYNCKVYSIYLMTPFHELEIFNVLRCTLLLLFILPAQAGEHTRPVQYKFNHFPELGT